MAEIRPRRVRLCRLSAHLEPGSQWPRQRWVGRRTEERLLRPEAQAPFLTSRTPCSVQVSASVSLPHQETSKYLVKRESVTHTIPLLMGHPPRSSPPAVWLPQVSRTVTLLQLLLEDGTKNLRAYWKTFSSIASDLQWFLLKCFNVQTVKRLKKKNMIFPKVLLDVWRHVATNDWVQVCS